MLFVVCTQLANWLCVTHCGKVFYSCWPPAKCKESERVSSLISRKSSRAGTPKKGNFCFSSRKKDKKSCPLSSLLLFSHPTGFLCHSFYLTCLRSNNDGDSGREWGDITLRNNNNRCATFLSSFYFPPCPTQSQANFLFYRWSKKWGRKKLFLCFIDVPESVFVSFLLLQQRNGLSSKYDHVCMK